MPKSLDELLLFVRETVPQPKSIQRLQPLEKADAVRFVWSGREFVVIRSPLQALEIKSNRLFVTGASLLIQWVLKRRTNHEEVLGTVLDNLQQVEQCVKYSNRSDKGFKLLLDARASLKKLIVPTSLEAPRRGHDRSVAGR